MRNKTLDFLKKKQGYVSGEDISRHLGMSRQGVWKHIQELKDSGYDIASVPHLGHKLISPPDRLYPSEISAGLNTKFIAKSLHYYDAVSSTMDIAYQLGMKGSPEGTVVVTESQSKGRGRFSRHWLSPKYKGIYLSLILRPRIMPQQAPILTLLAGVSTCKAVEEATDLEAKIKWPNDIMVHQKKAGGILTEISAEQDQIHFVVVGIGINVNNDEKSLSPSATSLREQKGQMVNRVELLQELLRAIEKEYALFEKEGAASIIEQWRVFASTLGRRVKITYQHTHAEGEAIDIDKDGALLVRTDSGVIQKFTAGDITHCR